MREAVIRGRINPLVRQKASEIVAVEAGEKDWFGQIRALHAFVRDKVMYVRDVNGVETVREADRVLIDGIGDCDDKSVLLAAMLESVGHPTRLVAVGFAPGEFHHVLVETMVAKRPRPKWMALETTERVRAGWYPPGVVARKVKHI